jgi:4-hydroxy-tetrahydrodipicolinate reductase
VINIVVAGIRGRMGRAVLQLAGDGAPATREFAIIGGIGRSAGSVAGPGGEVPVTTPDGAGEILRAAQALIDFSGTSGTEALLAAQPDSLHGTAVIIGSTGMPHAVLQRIDALAAHAAVLTAANFSIGVNLLLALVERTAATLPAEQYAVEVVEAHHGRKLDAPSGTALALAEAAARGRDVILEDVRRDGRSGEPGIRPAGEIGIHAVRGGGVIGEHDVLFLGERERIVLRHVAQDRALFAEGALHAARWLAGRPAGRYSMKDVLGLGS